MVQLLAKGQPVSPLHLAGVLHRTTDEVRAERRAHPELEYDANGNIVGSGLTLVPTAYQVQMNDHRLFAWCALGALTIRSSFSFQRVFFRGVRRPER